MNRSSLVWRILSLSLPMAWSRFIQMVGWFAGMIMLAHLGKTVLAASALINMAQITICVVFMTLLFAVGVVTGRLYGEGKHREMGVLAQQSCLLGILTGLLAMVAFWFVGKFLLLTGQSPQLVAIVTRYFHTFVWISIPLMWLVTLQQFAYGILKQRVVIINNIISLVIFLPVTYFFIYGGLGLHPYGVIGLAYGIMVQVLVNLFTLVACMYWMKSFEPYQLFKRHRHKNFHYIKQLYTVGWPMCVQFGGELVAFFVMTIFIGWLGVAALSASQVTMQVMLLFLVPLFAIAEAAGILVSQAIGSRTLHEVSAMGRTCVWIGVVGVLLLSILFFAIPDQLTAMYVDIKSPANIKTIILARKLFYISSLMLMLDTMRNLYAGALRGFYDTKYPMWISLISLWVIAIPLSYFLGIPAHLGVLGIRLACIIGFAFGVFVLWRRWHQKSSMESLSGM